jgi:hypothetical protein
MRKLFKEILGSKIIALLLIFGTVILSLYAVYFNARADENIHSHRYDYGQTGSKEEIQKSIDEAEAEYEDLISMSSYDSKNVRLQREKLFVLKELFNHADEVGLTDLYEGLKADQQDACSFIAESVPIAAVLTVIMVVVLAATLITAEFDEGVQIYIYYTSRTKHMLKRAATVLITGLAAYLWFCGFVFFISKAFPEFHTHGLIVTADRAYIVGIKSYLLTYVFARYFFIFLFASLLIILTAVIVRKSLPLYGISAGIIGVYYAL